jgi:hypothetical protein
MTRKLKKEIWPYCHFIKDDIDEHGYVADNEDQDKITDWIFKNFSENIKNRIYLIENSKGTVYYFKDEKDYSWFIWRWG